jgi:hypothetical protein
VCWYTTNTSTAYTDTYAAYTDTYTAYASYAIMV